MGEPARILPPPTYHTLIREMPTDERPRERLRTRGAAALSNGELLAILFRTGSAGENVLSLGSRILTRAGGLAPLARLSFPELCAERGIGEAKAAQLLAAIELGRRVAAAQPEDRVTIRSPEDVAALLQADMADLEQEHLRVLLLNVRNQVMGVKEVYVGNVHSAVVRVAEVLRDAVRENCPNIIVVHNHPSGDPSPSRDDVSLTKQLREAGQLLGIDVLDHIVVARGGHASLKERGQGFS